MKKRYRTLLYLIMALLLLSACGGGDSGKPAQDSNNWNEMIWDQDNWS